MINAILPRFFRVAYRKEPISSFILIFGAVDAVIGGVGERWTLLSLGLLIVVLGGIVKWLQTQKTPVSFNNRVPRHMLPPSNSASTPLPVLKHPHKRR